MLRQPPSEFLLDLDRFWLSCQVHPLVRILNSVIQLFATIAVADIAPFLRADRMIRPQVSRNCRRFLRSLRRLYPPHERLALLDAGRFEAGKVHQSWININSADGLIANGARTGHARRHYHEEISRGTLPQRELAPV